jgi:cyclase
MRRHSSGKLSELTQDVFAFTHHDEDDVLHGYGANQGFVLLEESVLVFDTGFATELASGLDSAIRSVTDNPVRYVVNSHDHSDHVFGNSFFSKRYKDVQFFSHEICKQRIEDQARKRLQGYRSRGAALKQMLSTVDILEPNVTYDDISIKLLIEGYRFVFVHPPTGAHTLGDTLLFIPKKRSLFAGDVVWTGFLPNLEDANIDGWIEMLENLDQSYKYVLPGHGAPCGMSEVGRFTEYLKEVRGRLRKVEQMKETRREKLRKCFEVEGTEDWKMRLIVDINVSALFGVS